MSLPESFSAIVLEYMKALLSDKSFLNVWKQRKLIIRESFWAIYVDKSFLNLWKQGERRYQSLLFMKASQLHRSKIRRLMKAAET